MIKIDSTWVPNNSERSFKKVLAIILRDSETDFSCKKEIDISDGRPALDLASDLATLASEIVGVIE